MKRVLFPALALLFFSQNAYCLVLTEFLAVNTSFPNLSSTIDPSLKAGLGLSLGGGISVGVRTFTQTDVEIGIVYMTRHFPTFSSTTSNSGYGIATAQIPLLLRYWLNEKYSVGIGPYISHGIGNLTQTINSQQQISGFSDLGWGTDEFGFQTSFRYRTALNSLISIILDGRLSIGLTQLNQTGTRNFLAREFQSWCGIAFVL